MSGSVRLEARLASGAEVTGYGVHGNFSIHLSRGPPVDR